jgi:hypothetical protein
MKQVARLAPFTLLASLLFQIPAMATTQPGDYSFTAGIGQSGPNNDSAYRSDQSINFALLYQKTGSAAYRAMAGLLSMNGRESISPAAGTRDADAFYMTGDLVYTPRFRIMHPFAAAGVGFYDLRLIDDQDTQNSVEIGLNWGFGLDVQILRWFAVHGEVDYHYITGGISSPIQIIVIGGRFDF